MIIAHVMAIALLAGTGGGGAPGVDATHAGVLQSRLVVADKR